MDTITDEANVLRHYPLGETGIIVVALTHENGLLHAVAKGARSPKNAFFGKIDLFYKLTLTWKPARGEGLSALNEIKLLSPREQIRKNYLCTATGAYFTKLLEKGLECGHPAPEFHDLMERALNYLDSKEPELKAIFHFEKELVRLHGIENVRHSAAQSLQQFLGGLPKQRENVLKLFSCPQQKIP